MENGKQTYKILISECVTLIQLLSSTLFPVGLATQQQLGLASCNLAGKRRREGDQLGFWGSDCNLIHIDRFDTPPCSEEGGVSKLSLQE